MTGNGKHTTYKNGDWGHDKHGIMLPTLRYNVGPPAPKIAKLVHNSNFTMVYGTQRTIVMGVYKPTYNWGGPHCKYGTIMMKYNIV